MVVEKSRPRRSRKTSARVRIAEKASRVMITIGGAGTIVAVTGIFAFLVWVVLPLFQAADVRAAGELEVGVSNGADPEHLVVDEYRVLASAFLADGSFRVVQLADGSQVDFGDLFEERTPTARAFSTESGRAAFGFASGDVAVTSFDFEVDFPEEGRVPEELQQLARDQVAVFEHGIVQLTPEGKLRHQRFRVDEPKWVPTKGRTAITHLDFTAGIGRDVVCALDAAGVLTYYDLSERENLLTGEVTYRSKKYELPYDPPQGEGLPDHMLLSGIGDSVLLIWNDGTLHRIDARDPAAAQVVEITDLVPDESQAISAVSFLLGKTTLLVGDTGGDLNAWFLTKPVDAGTLDGSLLSRAHTVHGQGSAVTAIGPSPRSKLLSVGYADGGIRLVHLTSGKEVAQATFESERPVTVLSVVPKEDGLVALSGTWMGRWDVDPLHPEASLRGLFGQVWYEGYEGPEHVWQSSSGTDDFEEKLGLVPLVYGTVKATFYSMLFGAPLALLAAVFTSEFLDRRVRTPVKSSIEMMASLPSVVLGFLAALILAPFVQSVLPATLALLFLWPATLLTGAFLWQLVPRPVALRLNGLPRMIGMALTLPIAVGLSMLAGPAMESAFFGGDIELWLDGGSGNAWGGWFLLLLPLCAIVAAFGSCRWIAPMIRSRSAEWTAAHSARVDLVKFAAVGLGAVGLAFAVGQLLQIAGIDPRGGLVGTYVQRNALVVGFVMGFAVIPIIYTLAEDALSSVPEHLRLASLAAGATQWQTAMRIIVPTAMSGLFSALMIGLGRAVGETMVVLMATGNTPVMDLNIFNGFRTLSANIAVELPEAVQNSTHYRTLFLAALVLFAMTFCVNTLAELVRQRFRKKAVQL